MKVVSCFTKEPVEQEAPEGRALFAYPYLLDRLSHFVIPVTLTVLPFYKVLGHLDSQVQVFAVGNHTMSRQQAGAFKTTNKVVVVEGTLKAEEIKSSMTLEELAMGFNASLNTLLKFLSLPQDVPGSTKLRDLEDIDESMTTKSVRSKMSSFG